MTLYVDSSAFLKVYLQEPESQQCKRFLASAGFLVTARHTSVEVRRNLSLSLKGKALAEARRQFQKDWQGITKLELSKAACEGAASIAEAHAVRSLDALHLGAAELVRTDDLDFLTYDARQARAARRLGWTVRGAGAEVP